MSWYTVGQQAGEAQAKARAFRRIEVDRVFIPAGVEKILVPLDDETFNFSEHAYCVAGKWGNYGTCPFKGCGLCNGFGKGAFESRAITVFDAQGYPSRDNPNEIKGKGELRLYVMPAVIAPKHARARADAGGSLILRRVRVTRDGTNEPTCGSSFTPIGDPLPSTPVGLAAIFRGLKWRGKPLEEHWQKAEADAKQMAFIQKVFNVKPVGGKLPRVPPIFNYEDLLTPPTDDEVTAILKSADFVSFSEKTQKSMSSGKPAAKSTAPAGATNASPAEGEHNHDPADDADDIPF